MRYVFLIGLSLGLSCHNRVQAQPAPYAPYYWPVTQPVTGMKWFHHHADGESRIYLYNGNQVLGRWDRVLQRYETPDGRGGYRVSTATPPLAVPWHLRPAPENYGVDWSKVKGCKQAGEDSCYKLGGVVGGVRYSGAPLDRETAHDFVENGVPDDRGKPYIAVFGQDQDRKRFEQDYYALPANDPLRAKALIYSVPPDHWCTKDNTTGQPLYKVDGSPTVYVIGQPAPGERGGKVLWRQDSYGGPSDFQALRKAVEGYDPKKDPGPFSIPGLPPINLRTIALALLGGAAVLFLRKEK